MTTPPQKTTLESLVTRFRRQAGTPELEIRFPNMDLANFTEIARRLAATTGTPGVLTQTVNAIMPVPARESGAPLHKTLAPSRIREISFDGPKKTGERYVYKEPLMLPWRQTTSGLTWIAALSAERPARKEDFTIDESGLIRLKSRLSFRVALGEQKFPWRVDLTATRQLAGSSAGDVPGLVAGMFANRDPAQWLAALGLAGPTGAAPVSARSLPYRYEVEVEFDPERELATGAPGRDLVRPADIVAAATYVLGLANEDHLAAAQIQAEVFRAARYIVRVPTYLAQFEHALGLKRLLPAVNALTRADYRELYPPRGMYLTAKADGRRALGVVHDGRGAVVSDRWLPSATGASADPSLADDTILDGELVGEVFYAFDVVALQGQDYTQEPFEQRLGQLAAGVRLLRAAGLAAEAKPYAHLTGGTPAALEREIRGVLESAALPFATDGLIFVEPGKPYRDTRSFKWKPLAENTIDFLVRRPPASVLGKPPFVDREDAKLYWLFVGITPELAQQIGIQRCPGWGELFAGRADDGAGGVHFPIQFAPSDAPWAYLYWHPRGAGEPAAIGGGEAEADLDGKVIEFRCRCDPVCRAAGGAEPYVAWEAVRRRADRDRDLAARSYYGNDYRVAELTWLNYIDPFPAAELWDGPGAAYFQHEKLAAYRAQTAVVSFVKQQLIGRLRHAAWVVDLGIGKGQDLGRYIDAEVQHLVGVDADRAALAELVRRKYSHATRTAPGRGQQGRGGQQRRHAATVLYTLLADLTSTAETDVATAEVDAAEVDAAAMSAPRATAADLRHRLAGTGFPGADAVVCNLAVHYFLQTPAHLRRWADLVRGLLRPGQGTVVVTALFGELVHALFMRERVPPGGTWERHEDGVLKYSLRRLYSSDRVEAAGQKIGVLLPFSAGAYYEEYLVSTAELGAQLEARGLRLEHKETMDASIADWEARNPGQARTLTAADREWLGLYGSLVFGAPSGALPHAPPSGGSARH